MKIISKCPTPSSAVRAMIAGLDEAFASGDFHVHMGTFGGTHDGKCCGCAATCALQHIGGKRFTKDNIADWISRSLFFGVDPEELCAFEHAIDGIRHGDMSCLELFYDYELPFTIDSDFWLQGHMTEWEWVNKRPAYIDLAETLESKSL